MDKYYYAETNQQTDPAPVPSFTQPVWGDRNMSCGVCDFNGQDVDTFPCAKCHTRG